MTVLSVVLMSLSQLTLAAVTHGGGVIGKRNAALKYEAAKFDAPSFTSLASWSTEDKTVTRDNFSYTRKVSITPQSPMEYTIKIVVVPTADPTKRDSVVLDRTVQ